METVENLFSDAFVREHERKFELNVITVQEIVLRNLFDSSRILIWVRDDVHCMVLDNGQLNPLVYTTFRDNIEEARRKVAETFKSLSK